MGRRQKGRERKKERKGGWGKQTSSGRDLAMSPEHFVLTRESWEGMQMGLLNKEYS